VEVSQQPPRPKVSMGMGVRVEASPSSRRRSHIGSQGGEGRILGMLDR